jgi:23S rRNA (guanosine2251-2'-O)-methyltransferase
MNETTVIYGLHAVSARLRRGNGVQRLWVLDSRHDARLEAILKLAETHGVTIERSSRAQLDELTGTSRHQGVAARVTRNRPRGEADLKDLLAVLEQPPFLLILDGVQDPRNLGACLRTAAGAGVDGVIVPKDRSAPLSAAARKAASGAAEIVPLFQVTNLARALRWLKRQGVWLTGATAQAPQTVYDIALSGPLGVVLGAEGQGLRRLTREHCDFLVRIPLAASVESLNVAVATGIVLFEAKRQRV